MDKDNIINAVPRISIENPTSQKTGNKYNRLVLHFHDGYDLTLLLNNEQVQCIKYSVANVPPSQDFVENQ